MARIRTIKPEFWTDEKMVAISPLARLLFIGLWNFVDDEGRCDFSPVRIRYQVLPADDVDVAALVGELAREGAVLVYEVDGKQFLQVRNFAKHQKVDKRQASKYPAPPDTPPAPADLPQLAPEPPDGSRIKEGIKERSTAREGDSVQDDYDEKVREYLDCVGEHASPDPRSLDISPLTALVAKGYNWHRDILATVREKRPKLTKTVSPGYFVPIIQERFAIPEKPKQAEVVPTEWVNVDDPRFPPGHKAITSRDHPGEKGWNFKVGELYPAMPEALKRPRPAA